MQDPSFDPPDLADMFAAAALIGLDCRGLDPAIAAARCYDVSAAMLARRAELRPPEPLPAPPTKAAE